MENVAKCPKCGAGRTPGDTECPVCGVIYAKAVGRVAQKPMPKIEPVPNKEDSQPLLAPCAACGKNVSKNAVACPHCGEPVEKSVNPEDVQRDETISSANSESVNSKKESKNVGCGTLILAAIVVVGGIYFHMNDTPKTPSSSSQSTSKGKINQSSYSEEEKNGQVTAACHAEVEKFLKSPSSAKFPWRFEVYKIKDHENMYQNKSYVDSQNGFGAMLRTNYVCEVELLESDIKDKFKYRITYLDLDGKIMISR